MTEIYNENDLKDIDGVTPQLFATIQPEIDGDAYAPEIAVISFWKLNDEGGDFFCYKHFKVPNPMKREIRRSVSSEHQRDR